MTIQVLPETIKYQPILDYYNSHKEAIEDNYQIALQYINYEQSIVNKIEKIFKLNNL